MMVDEVEKVFTYNAGGNHFDRHFLDQVLGPLLINLKGSPSLMRNTNSGQTCFSVPVTEKRTLRRS